MTYEIKSSDTEKVDKLLLLALSGTTGSGKTESAMRLATGMVGAGNFCVIDTEHKRALNKKNRYKFGHMDLKAPYSPDNFKGAIEAAIKAGYKAIIIDNFSHEWFGEGGCSDIAEAVLERMCKGDMNKAERMTALGWKEPKQLHKKLIYRILQSEVPIIFCLRAEPKIKFAKDDRGKTQVVDAGWQPICEKMFPYEMLVYALLMPENPGVPVHLKKLEEEFVPMMPVGKQLDESVGRKLMEWAAGGVKPATVQPEDGPMIKEALHNVISAIKDAKIEPDKFLSAFGINKTTELKSSQYETVMAWIDGERLSAE